MDSIRLNSVLEGNSVSFSIDTDIQEMIDLVQIASEYCQLVYDFKSKGRGHFHFEFDYDF